MKRQLVSTAAALVCLFAVGTGSASAQTYYPGVPHYSQPFGNTTGLSPYLNLLRGGDISANYFLGVVPEFQRRANYNQLRTAIQEVDMRAAQAETDVLDLARPLEMTGHPTGFGYYSSFYPGLGTGRPGGMMNPYGQR